MAWLERVSAAPSDGTTQPTPATNAMKLGHGEDYDAQLREKASVHNPPTPPEYMGFEGEYDTAGLAKRLAKRLEDTQVEDVPTLEIVQREAVICLEGSVPSQELLNRVMNIAAHVDGIQAVDVSKVAVNFEV
ncbi:MAG TPA: BON domain-containing protein [Leptolyngbyaceae cyanobacterium]